MGTKLAHLNKPISITPLIAFRIIFGLLMCFSLVRFWWHGWIEAVYITPKFHFTYWGFDWVKTLGNPSMYLMFVVVIVAALCITIGLFYRIAAATFFFGFTYIELIDVSTYLNHYYFISLVAFIMIWLPAHRLYSLDVYFRLVNRKNYVPFWCIGIIRFQLAVVYFFAGLAKLNYDWLVLAEPMRTWLPAKTHLPIVGTYMYKEWVAYLFSWFGAVYDLFIVFFLLNKKTRPYAYICVLAFHVATAIFFPSIGMFPYMMIALSIIFISSDYYKNIFTKILPKKNTIFLNESVSVYHFRFPKLVFAIGVTYVFFQLVIPLRFLAYPDHLFWTEEGYRFSWRVMLMEKVGNAIFRIKEDAKVFEVNNAQYLTPFQEKMMSTQPDMILKYTYYLAAEYKKNGLKNPEVYGEVYVTLNGVPSRLFIDSTVNLAQQPLSWRHYSWVLPYQR